MSTVTLRAPVATRPTNAPTSPAWLRRWGLALWKTLEAMGRARAAHGLRHGMYL